MVAIGLAPTLGADGAFAEQIYDNIGPVRPNNSDVILAERNYWFLAQPIDLGDHDNISQITLALGRFGGSGSIDYSIWDDNGRGIPHQKIADLGTVDISQLDDLPPRQPTVTLPTVTFDSPVTDLTPHEIYYIMADWRNVSGGNATRGNTIGFGALDNAGGARGADHLIATKESVGLDWQDSDWESLAVFGLRDRWMQMSVQSLSTLQAGDANRDLEFDQLDLVQVQRAAKYLTGHAATWGEGDWNGAPGGSATSPPTGNGLFDQWDVIAAQQASVYLSGPYAAIQAGGTTGDGQTSVAYNASTGELSVDAPTGVELTSINIESMAGIFSGGAAQGLGGSFDNDADNNIFKATFGGSFGSLDFGPVAQVGLSEEFVLNDLSVVGSLAGGGDLGQVDLVYIPESSGLGLLAIGLAVIYSSFRPSSVQRGDTSPSPNA